jgi:hypothetical protein
MERLFAPAIALMNRLKYPQKFLLVGLLLVLPLGIVMRQFLMQINYDIEFSYKEQLGLEYHTPLVQFMRGVQMHRTYSAALLYRIRGTTHRVATADQRSYPRGG